MCIIICVWTTYKRTYKFFNFFKFFYLLKYTLHDKDKNSVSG